MPNADKNLACFCNAICPNRRVFAPLEKHIAAIDNVREILMDHSQKSRRVSLV